MGIMDNSYDKWLGEVYCNGQSEVPMYRLLNPDINMSYRNGLKIITTYEILENSKNLQLIKKDLVNKANLIDRKLEIKKSTKDMFEVSLISEEIIGGYNEYMFLEDFKCLMKSINDAIGNAELYVEK